MIGMTKKLIRSTIGTRNVDMDDFETLLAGASGIMNRRPLMPASADIDDDLVLSPAHFLYPYLFVNSASQIMPPCSGEPEMLRHGWRSSQTLLGTFWAKFRGEYLQTLAKRRKTDSSEPMKVGDVVIVVEPSEPREYWRLGRIVKIVNTEPGHPRRFIVRDSKNNSLDRGINGIIRLHLRDNA